MSFFDQLKKSGQETLGKAKDMTEIARMNLAISDSEKKLHSQFAQLGRTWFERYGASPEAAFEELTDSIKEQQAKLADCREKVKALKGMEQCPNCGADMEHDAAFCAVCGGKRPGAAQAVSAVTAPGQYCPSCGRLVGSRAFCSGCGAKLVPMEAETGGEAQPFSAQNVDGENHEV